MRKNLDYKLINNLQAQKPAERANLAIDHISSNIIETILMVNSTEPSLNNVNEVRKSADAEKWEAAMDKELEMMKKMKTWELVDAPIGKNVVGCRWVFTMKKDEHGNIARYKARLVAQGFSQKPGVDYSNMGTFAPVMCFESLRMHLALAAENDWELHQYDVKSTYLNGKLKEEIYMCQPPGFNDGSGRVCRLL